MNWFLEITIKLPILILIVALTMNNDFPINQSSASTNDNSNNIEIYGTTDSNVTITCKTLNEKITLVVTIIIITIISAMKIMTLRHHQTQNKLC